MNNNSEESLQSLFDHVNGVDIDTIKKRHIFYIWMNFYSENMSFSSFYESTYKKISCDYNFFLENYVKHNYILLYKKNDKEKLTNYVSIMKGQRDIIIDMYLENLTTFEKKNKKWCCY